MVMVGLPLSKAFLLFFMYFELWWTLCFWKYFVISIKCIYLNVLNCAEGWRLFVHVCSSLHGTNLRMEMTILKQQILVCIDVDWVWLGMIGFQPSMFTYKMVHIYGGLIVGVYRMDQNGLQHVHTCSESGRVFTNFHEHRWMFMNVLPWF